MAALPFAAPVPSGNWQALTELLVSPVTGILRSIIVSPHCSDEPSMLCPMAELGNFERLPGMGAIDPTGGCGFTTGESVARILFETVERYCGAFVDHSRMAWGKALPQDYLYAGNYPLYADHQYEQKNWPFRRLTEQSEIWWTEGRSLVTHRPVWVPAVFTHVPYRASSQEEWLGPSVSTGMAASWSWEDAVLNAVLELCERDAFTMMWMNRLSMPRIAVSPNSPFGKQLARALGKGGAQVEFVNITNDLGIPTVLAVFRYTYMGRPVVTLGASTKLDPEQACRKAFAEAADGYGRIVSQIENLGSSWQPAEDYSNITDWTWHGLAYADSRLQKLMDFVTASEHVQPLESFPTLEHSQGGTSRLQWTLNRLRQHFKEIAVVDLTTREFAELGVHAVKAFIPEAVPLHPDHRYPWLGHSRLYEVPVQLGYRQQAATPHTLNTDPHPFA